MKTNYFENRNVGITITSIAVLLLLTTGFFTTKNLSLKNQIKDIKIKTEALVSENLSKTKSVEKLSADIKILLEQNKVFKESLGTTHMKIVGLEGEINKLRGQNSNASFLSKKVKELEQLKSDYEKQIEALYQNTEDLNRKNKELTVLLEEAQNKNTVLEHDKQILGAMAGNNYRIEAFRGKKEKLTVKARWSKKIVVNLDVPDEVVQNIYFKVKTPGKQQFSSKVHTKILSINMPKSSDNGDISNPIKLEGEILKMSKIELIFTPEKKLEKGIYSFDIFNIEQYVGSTQIRLR